jgi:hypothetical protein
MSAIALLTKAIEYDVNGRKLEALKLYEDGIGELLKQCKGNFTILNAPTASIMLVITQSSRIQRGNSIFRLKSSNI